MLQQTLLVVKNKEIFVFSTLSSHTQSNFQEALRPLVTQRKGQSSCKYTPLLCFVNEVINRQILTFKWLWHMERRVRYYITCQGTARRLQMLLDHILLDGILLLFFTGFREFQEEQRYAYFQLNQSYTMPNQMFSEISAPLCDVTKNSLELFLIVSRLIRIFSGMRITCHFQEYLHFLK